MERRSSDLTTNGAQQIDDEFIAKCLKKISILFNIAMRRESLTENIFSMCELIKDEDYCWIII